MPRKIIQESIDQINRKAQALIDSLRKPPGSTKPTDDRGRTTPGGPRALTTRRKQGPGFWQAEIE